MNESPEMKIPERMLAGNSVQPGMWCWLTHSHPDGDALGSLFGFAEILDVAGQKGVLLSGRNGFPSLRFSTGQLRGRAPASKNTVNLSPEPMGISSLISLDCGDDDRLGKAKQKFLEIEPFLVIDHHRSHRQFGTISWVDPHRSSTGEMVYELALALEAPLAINAPTTSTLRFAPIPAPFATNAPSPRTMHIAAELLEKGVRPEEVSSHLYDNSSQERLKLMEMVLATIDSL